MADGLSFTLDTKMLDAIVRDCDKKGEQILRKLAFEIEKTAKQLAPYDTTALRNSIYTQTSKGEYSDGRSAGFTGIESKVHEKRPDAKTDQLPTPNDNEVFVGPCVDYGASVEFGHGYGVSYSSSGEVDFAKGYVDPHPYLTPAVEAIRSKFESGETYRELCDPKSEDWLI